MGMLEMRNLATILFVAMLVTGCDVVSTLTNGFNYARAVEADLAASTGAKPEVGFNWSNGRLTRVTVTFPRMIESRPLADLAQTVRHAVADHFKQTPGDIVLGFSLGRSGAGQTTEGTGLVHPVNF
jgi:hypothetical protein